MRSRATFFCSGKYFTGVITYFNQIINSSLDSNQIPVFAFNKQKNG